LIDGEGEVSLPRDEPRNTDDEPPIKVRDGESERDERSIALVLELEAHCRWEIENEKRKKRMRVG
jgi:hypothetical protein